MKILNAFNRIRRSLNLPDVTMEPSKNQIPEEILEQIQADDMVIEDETIDEQSDIETDDTDNTIEFSEMEETYIDSIEKEEMDAEYDEGYMQYSSEVVGFGNREIQWNAYRAICSYIDSNSVIDFGCARGDFQAFYQSEYPEQEPLDYVGIDSNLPLVEAGLQIYPGINIIQTDWFNLDESIQRDWAVNIGSCNLRYDTDITTDDIEYTQNTIKKMYAHCTKGLVIMLASDISGNPDGLINYNPGSLLNWAQLEFSNVALDHSMGDDVFCLIIYK
jgi:hypothetical protein